MPGAHRPDGRLVAAVDGFGQFDMLGKKIVGIDVCLHGQPKAEILAQQHVEKIHELDVAGSPVDRPVVFEIQHDDIAY